jgi:hypothetical protein
MFGTVVSVLFRSVLDEVCADLPTHEAEKNALVVSKPPDGTPKRPLDADNLSAVGRKAPLPAPSMWN